MSSSGYLASNGGVFLPVPSVIIKSLGGTGVKQHYYARVGGADKPTFEQYKGLELSIHLLRYKRGMVLNRDEHTGYNYDAKRGWVHPSPNRGGSLSAKDGGGSHQGRGFAMPVRETEWLVTKPDYYDGIFNPELWFTNGGNLLTYPVGEWQNIGQSGQSRRGGHGGSSVQPDSNVWIDKKPHAYTQDQWFSFCFAIRNPKDRRSWIRGAQSEKIRASLFPSLSVTYSVPPLKERGRMIMLRQC